MHFLGRVSRMTYITDELRPPEFLAWTGRTSLVHARDEIVVRPVRGGTTVEYASSFGYRRLSWLLEWLLRPALNRLCDDAQRGLQRALSSRRSEGAS